MPWVVVTFDKHCSCLMLCWCRRDANRWHRKSASAANRCPGAGAAPAPGLWNRKSQNEEGTIGSAKSSAGVGSSICNITPRTEVGVCASDRILASPGVMWDVRWMLIGQLAQLHAFHGRVAAKNLHALDIQKRLALGNHMHRIHSKRNSTIDLLHATTILMLTTHEMWLPASKLEAELMLQKTLTKMNWFGQIILLLVSPACGKIRIVSYYSFFSCVCSWRKVQSMPAEHR